VRQNSFEGSGEDISISIFSSDSDLISIETMETMGRIDVEFIDRDKLKNEFFPFTVDSLSFFIVFNSLSCLL
jgi:hypothetical protein